MWLVVTAIEVTVLAQFVLARLEDFAARLTEMPITVITGITRASVGARPGHPLLLALPELTVDVALSTFRRDFM